MKNLSFQAVFSNKETVSLRNDGDAGGNKRSWTTAQARQLKTIYGRLGKRSSLCTGWKTDSALII
jgi:hypothetical protein